MDVTEVQYGHTGSTDRISTMDMQVLYQTHRSLRALFDNHLGDPLLDLAKALLSLLQRVDRELVQAIKRSEQ